MPLNKVRFLLALFFSVAIVGGCASHHNMEGMSAADHSKHMAMLDKKGYDRSVETYQIPDLLLVDNRGQSVELRQLLATDKPVIVNFLYATCTTICPLLSMGYIDLQRELGPGAKDVLLVSVTIDPEHDTPEVLEAYRNKYHGKPGWTLLTGSRLDIDSVMTAFDAYVGDKMDHQPLNFIRLPEQNKWVRLDGMLNGKDFVHEMEIAGVR